MRQTDGWIALFHHAPLWWKYKKAADQNIPHQRSPPTLQQWLLWALMALLYNNHETPHDASVTATVVIYRPAQLCVVNNKFMIINKILKILYCYIVKDNCYLDIFIKLHNLLDPGQR